MGSGLSSKDNELQRIADEVLHYVWDPIGISCFPQARDEYYTYSAQAFVLLRDGATQEAIAEYLGSVSTELMGLAANPENDTNAASLLCEWREVINKKYLLR